MSDGPRYTTPGNSGDDLFRWSGRDGQQNNGQQGQSGDRDQYIYDGSRQNPNNE